MTCDCESCVVPGALIEYLSGDVMSVSVQSTSKEGPFVRFVRDAYQPKKTLRTYSRTTYMGITLFKGKVLEITPSVLNKFIVTVAFRSIIHLQGLLLVELHTDVYVHMRICAQPLRLLNS